jgi:hypothetical protein
MPSFYVPLLTILIGICVAILFGVMAPTVLLRRSSDKGLAGFSLVTCVAAFGFAPLLRVSPEAMGIYIFLAGFFPICAAITAAVVTSAARFIQTRQWASVPGMLLSVAAAGLMVVNTTTPWLWRYAKY